MTEKQYALGIDLGGTSVKTGVVNREGKILAQAEVPTEAAKGLSTVIANMAEGARQAVAKAGLTLDQVAGAGIGAPGICNVAEGVIVATSNLGGLNQIPVCELLSKELGLPVTLENDANCAALGEQWCGAAKGAQHVILITLGTGVGGGLILNGRIYNGFKGWAGELGHMPAVEDGLQCGCGQRGCLETVASATAIGRYAQEAIDAGRADSLAKRAQEMGKVDARLVITAAREGDAVAQAILNKVAHYLGRGLAGLISALNPEAIVVGGGASAAGELLLEPVRQVIQSHAMADPVAVCRVLQATLGNDAGLLGAASLVWR
jgi:glucokinase